MIEAVRQGTRGCRTRCWPYAATCMPIPSFRSRNTTRRPTWPGRLREAGIEVREGVAAHRLIATLEGGRGVAAK